MRHKNRSLAATNKRKLLAQLLSALLLLAFYLNPLVVLAVILLVGLFVWRHVRAR